MRPFRYELIRESIHPNFEKPLNSTQRPFRLLSSPLSESDDIESKADTTSDEQFSDCLATVIFQDQFDFPEKFFQEKNKYFLQFDKFISKGQVDNSEKHDKVWLKNTTGKVTLKYKSGNESTKLSMSFKPEDYKVPPSNSSPLFFQPLIMDGIFTKKIHKVGCVSTEKSQLGILPIESHLGVPVLMILQFGTGAKEFIFTEVAYSKIFLLSDIFDTIKQKTAAIARAEIWLFSNHATIIEKLNSLENSNNSLEISKWKINNSRYAGLLKVVANDVTEQLKGLAINANLYQIEAPEEYRAIFVDPGNNDQNSMVFVVGQSNILPESLCKPLLLSKSTRRAVFNLGEFSKLIYSTNAELTITEASGSDIENSGSDVDDEQEEPENKKTGLFSCLRCFC